MLNPEFISTMCSVYVNTRPLARGDMILPVDQSISNLLTQIGDLKFKKIQIHMESGQVEFALGKSILQLLVWIGEQGSILSIFSDVYGH